MSKVEEKERPAVEIKSFETIRYGVSGVSQWETKAKAVGLNA